MKTVFTKKTARPDPELLTLKAELLEAQGDLAQAYRQFDQALDPELVESCIYKISAVKARCNYLIRAIKDVSFKVRKGEIVTLIGANGAGKTTTMQSITGLLHPKSGHIFYKGKELVGMPTHKIVKMGLTLVPEGRRVFAELTVYENLQMGGFTEKDRNKLKENLEMVYELFPRLGERRKQLAGALSGGEQQMLAIGRAMMCQPELLLLDEPSMGLSPLLVDQVFSIIQDLHKRGITVLLVEQNAGKALAVSDRAYVLETGRIVLSGTGKELAESPEVKKAYLGG